MKFALTLAVILGLAMVSQAALVTQIGSMSVDVTIDTTTPPSAGLTAYQFTLSSNLGIYSLDGRIDAFGGAVLNQVWTGPTGKTSTADPELNWGALSAANQLNDSNISVVSENRLDVRAPNENNTTPPTGTGTFIAGNPTGTLTMAFGLKNDAIDGYPLDLTNFAFSRLVVANTLTTIELTAPTSGPYVEWKFKIVDGQSALGNFDIFLAPRVPEPMTLSLLGAGALALIRRRR